ncbi:MAG: YceH family protein [Acidobacteria bacterium]|nr:YceH family protein [Acidobacteriota bacterium]
MPLVLNEYELRVLGALAEKQVATPDYYPMTLNALTNACNQKNHRDPVVSFDETTVVRALDSLREKKLIYTFHGSEARTIKYGHLFDKYFDLSHEEFAVLCVLILRGPQTPGELRSRTPHLLNFESLAGVEEALQSLGAREDPLVVRLPRQAGAREARFAHLLGGPINVEELAVAAPVRAESARAHSSVESERLAKLEADVVALRQELTELKQQLADFRKQFE